VIGWLGKPRSWAWLGGALLVLVIGIAGLSGLVLRQQLAPLQSAPLLLDNGARVQVEALHGNWFSTQAVVRLDWPLDSQRQLLLRLAGNFSHGPLPWQRLAQFDLRPAAFAGHLQLLSLDEARGEQLQALAASFDADLRVTYPGHLQTALKADIEQLPMGVWQLAAQGLQLELEMAASAAEGRLQLSAERLELRQGGAPLLRLRGIEQQGQLDTGAAGAKLALQAVVNELALWDQPLGQLSQNLQAEGIGLQPLLQALGGQTQAWAEALPAASEVQGTLLELENHHGNSQLRLDKPVGPQPLQIQAQLSRPMFLAAVENNAALQSQGSGIARQQALQLYAMVSQPLLQTGLFQSSDTGLRAELELDAAGLRSNLPTTFLSQKR